MRTILDTEIGDGEMISIVQDENEVFFLFHDYQEEHHVKAAGDIATVVAAYKQWLDEYIKSAI